MVWLNAANENGSGLYLNIHRIEERAGSLFALHGTVGDGYYEGEVVIEVGEGTDITFADDWLDRSALNEFFGHVDRADVESALAERASELLSIEEDRCSFKALARHSSRVRPRANCVKEKGMRWEAA